MKSRIFPLLLALALCAAVVLVVTAPQKSEPADSQQNPLDGREDETAPPPIPVEPEPAPSGEAVEIPEAEVPKSEPEQITPDPEPEPEPDPIPEPEPETPETEALLEEETTVADEPVEEPEPEPEPVEEPEPEPEPDPEPAPQAEPAPQDADSPVFSDAVQAQLDSMTTYELLTQMFIATYDGSWTTADYAANYGFGGYITFAEDYVNDTPESFRAGVDRVAAASKIPPFIAVDEEGGTVTRASKYEGYRSVPFDSPRNVYLAGGIEGIRTDAAEKADLLRSLGINYNLGPVADISVNSWDFMYARSPGQDAETTAEIVAAIVEESQARGVAASVKHFPGYGAVSDTHTGLAYDWRSVEELEARDLIPFRRAMDMGVSSVMVSHIITNLDSARPATVSSAVVDYIRHTMGYGGVLITDDMRMNGILDFCPTGNGSLEAILAGYDLICCTNWPEQFPVVWSAVEAGTLTRDRLALSAGRILQMKYDLGIWAP